MASWLDRMVRRVRDADTEEEAKEVTKDYLDPTGGNGEGGGGMNGENDTHIHLHMGGKGEGGGAGGMQGDDDPPIDVGQGGEPDSGQLAAAVSELLQRVEQLEQICGSNGGGGGGNGGENGEDGEEVELEDPETKDRRRFRMRRGDAMTRDEEDIPVPERLGEEMVGETDLPGLEDLDMPTERSGDRRRFRDRFARTTDSADAEDLWNDAMAAAEILQPGVRVPTFDARLTLESTAKRLCAFRRRVLDHALQDAETGAIIRESIGTIDAKVLPCDTVKMAFNAAASQLRLMNNRGQVRTGVTRDSNQGVRRGPPTIAEMNRNAGEFWSKQKTNGAMR